MQRSRPFPCSACLAASIFDSSTCVLVVTRSHIANKNRIALAWPFAARWRAGNRRRDDPRPAVVNRFPDADKRPSCCHKDVYQVRVSSSWSTGGFERIRGGFGGRSAVSGCGCSSSLGLLWLPQGFSLTVGTSTPALAPLGFHSPACISEAATQHLHLPSHSKKL